MVTRQLLFCLGIFIASAVFTPVMAKPVTTVSSELGFTSAGTTAAENFKPKKKKKARQKKSKRHCEAY